MLTREDYLRYADRRAALSGIVQALLITRHMLFIGFSLTDDNFHRIVDDVRKAIRGTEGGPATTPLGTALLLRSDDLLAELWAGDLELVSMTDADTGTTAEAVRALEIALDRLLASVTQGASPLLDPAYDGVLTDEEREVRRLLMTLTAFASDEAKASPAWRPIADLLVGLGGSAS